MTDKKLTDEEIIRNYEWCIGCTSDRCRECTMDEESFCEEELQDLVLDVINRQRAEIENAKAKIKICAEVIERQEAEIDNLNKQMEWLTGYNGNLINANTALSEEILLAKTEAYKELAERLKKLVRQNDYLLSDKYNSLDRGMFTIGFEQAIDNLLKEMVGEEE